MNFTRTGQRRGSVHAVADSGFPAAATFAATGFFRGAGKADQEDREGESHHAGGGESLPVHEWVSIQGIYRFGK